MRLKKFVRRISRGRRLRFGNVFARVIESQPLPDDGYGGRNAGRERCDTPGDTR